MRAAVVRSMKAHVLLCAALQFAACRPGPDGRGPRETAVTDLQPALERAVGAAGKRAGQPRMEVARAGRRLNSVVLIAPVHVEIPLGGTGRRTLELVAAPVFNIGDGMDLEILLAGETGTRRIYLDRFDAARRIADRSWRTFTIPLQLTGEKGQALQFQLAGGPHGDLVDDWLAFGRVVLSEGAASP